MRFAHPAHPARALRLGYCLNLHPAHDLDGLLDGLERIAGALAGRLRADGSPRGPFGVGMYLPGGVALALEADGAARERLATALAAGGFDAFTWNAFPFGRFHAAGLKADVFRPTWLEPERAAYTLAVARLAVELAGAPTPGRHLSISTHTGGFGSHVRTPGEHVGIAVALLGIVAELARLERESGWRVILSLEPEPGASAGSTAALAEFLTTCRQQARAVLELDEGEALALCARHLGCCLDTCHAAVEFEPPDDAWRQATANGTPLGKLQFTSALALAQPGRDAAGRAALLALDEPVYLHQTRGLPSAGPAGSAPRELLRVDDLDQLARALEDPASPWFACREWRCHFHVPVDLARFAEADPSASAAGLRTTRAEADDLLERALADPTEWGTDELHVEIETYTWSILSGAARGPGALVDGLEREYTHVLERLAHHGWQRTLP